MEARKPAATGGGHLGARDERQGKVMTVQGPVDPDQLGITLAHEHIFLHHTPPHLVLSDPDAAVEEVARFAAAGGGTISSDICYRQTLVRNGGWGYAHLLENVVPRLRKHGIAEEEIHAIMVENPRSVLPLQLGRTQDPK